MTLQSPPFKKKKRHCLLNIRRQQSGIHPFSSFADQREHTQRESEQFLCSRLLGVVEIALLSRSLTCCALSLSHSHLHWLAALATTFFAKLHAPFFFFAFFISYTVTAHRPASTCKKKKGRRVWSWWSDDGGVEGREVGA